MKMWFETISRLKELGYDTIEFIKIRNHLDKVKVTKYNAFFKKIKKGGKA
jgi:hypothetical protein